MEDEVQAKAAEVVERQATAAGKVLAGMVMRLIDDGVETAALAEALAEALGSVLGFAPRDKADQVLAGAVDRVRASRAAAWAELDAADAAVH